jgi:hypothetical protein
MLSDASVSSLDADTRQDTHGGAAVLVQDLWPKVQRQK